MTVDIGGSQPSCCVSVDIGQTELGAIATATAHVMTHFFSNTFFYQSLQSVSQRRNVSNV